MKTAHEYEHDATHAAQTEPTAVDVRVRELEWENHSYAPNHVRAKTPFGTYRIKGHANGAYWGCKADGLDLSYEAVCIEDAQVYAQADFERRVRDCLATTPAETSEVEADLKVGDWVRVIATTSELPHKYALGTVRQIMEVYDDGSGYDLGEWSCNPFEIERAHPPASSTDAATIERLTREHEAALFRVIEDERVHIQNMWAENKRANAAEAEAADLRRQLAESETRVGRIQEALAEIEHAESVYIAQRIARATLSSEGGSNADR